MRGQEDIRERRRVRRTRGRGEGSGIAAMPGVVEVSNSGAEGRVVVVCRCFAFTEAADNSADVTKACMVCLFMSQMCLLVL